jgi:hypothetical protein
MHRRLLCVATTALTFAVACRPRAATTGSQGGAVLVRVNGRAVTVDEAQADLDHLPAQLRATSASAPDKQREFLQKVIDIELLVSEARALGYDKDPEIIAATKRAMARKVMESRSVTPSSGPEIDQLAVEAFYRANQEMFRAPERVRLTQVIVADEQRAAEVWRLAKAAAGQHRGDPQADIAAFRELVMKYSVDGASRSVGGDLTVVAGSAGDPLRPLTVGAFALEHPGDIMSPIDIDGEFHVVKLREHVPAGPRPLDTELSNRIKRMLSDERSGAAKEQMLSELRRAAKVEVFDQHLTALRFDPRRSAHVASTDP